MNRVEVNTATPNVLIIDNDAALVRLLLELLARKSIRGTIANDEKTAAAFIDNNRWDLVFLKGEQNQRLDGKNHNDLSRNILANQTIRLLAKIKMNWPELPVVMLSDNDSVKMAVAAIRGGCVDFLSKPLDRRFVEDLLDTFIPNHEVCPAAYAQENLRNLYQIVGTSPNFVETIKLARKVAPTSAPVLITGENGTGKELLSYLIHHESQRRNGPFVKVNCAALNDSLLESELFGHEKGAFTGAYAQRKGRFELAHSGTLLLDEISETGLKFQAELLRVLEQQDFERVGGNENIKVNIRVISTTNRDLLGEVHQGCFRADLYYRLAAIRLCIPPLRERICDFPLLIWHFVNQYAREAQRKITELDPAMLDIFTKYHWPGNVRQLRNVVRTSLILGTGPTLSLADVSWLLDELQPRPQADPITFCTQDDIIDASFNPERFAGMSLEKLEQHAILATLRKTAGNQAKAAKVLGISDRTLREKIRRYRRTGSLQPV